ncbi:MAG: universal stress protein, partial [Chitinophagaceae bacterium]|nr:universal stress protein [Chitinophagaceae bacterium]
YHYAETDDIADEIEDFAEDQDAGLIITIPKSYGFFEGLFHRSVSKRLIRESDIPLLLLREREA